MPSGNWNQPLSARSAAFRRSRRASGSPARSTAPTAPEIALPIDRTDPAQRRRFRGIAIKLYRRTVEVRDGRFAIRQHLDAGVRESSEVRHRARGLHGEDLDATVAGDQILAGIAARAQGVHLGPDRLTDFADAHRRTSRPMDDVEALLAVARHLPREPARDLHFERASA
ncbi:DUF6545 domain-containing protein [Streptomyces sp. NPDC127033]|uniref:DUF6545 domain-containing protein n=1 Tax=Streptomyces sp. NPDC127033 TaxID=3347110 RepID=UPI0036487736